MNGQKTIRNLLIVDDEPQILKSLKRELKGEGYCIFTAESGRAGLDAVVNHDIGVVLSDQMMPGMDGIGFLEEVRRLKPQTVRIILTAYGSIDYASQAINRSNVFGYLSKPWNSGDLKKFLHSAFDHYELVMENRRLHHLTEEQNRQLRKSRDLLQSVFDGIAYPLMMIDARQDVLISNRAASGWYRPAGSVASAPSIREQLNEVYGTEKAREILEDLASFRSSKLRAESVRDDHFRLDEVTLFPIRNAEREEPAAILRIRDVTDEVLMIRKLVQHEKLASLGSLIVGLSHEISNPNNFVTLNMPVLRDYLQQILLLLEDHVTDIQKISINGMPYHEFREDIYKLLSNLENGAQRINAALSRLREFSRQRGIEREVIRNPAEIINRALFVCQKTIAKTTSKIDVSIQGDLTPICTDPFALEQILITLLINAAHAADKDDSFVRINAWTGPTWKERLIIEIEDNGCGMDKTIKERLFEPFFTTKKYGAGIGLGLFVSNKLLEDMGGTIEVDSKPNKGSMFRVRIPDIGERPYSETSTFQNQDERI